MIKIIKFFIAVVMFIAIVFLAVYIFGKSDKSISRVDIISNDGLVYISKQRLIDRVVNISNQDWIDVNASDVEKYLYAIKGVEYVLVKKVWPSTLVLYLYDRSPVAYWNNSQLLLGNMEVITPEVLNGEGILPYIDSNDDDNKSYIYGVYKKLNHISKKNSMDVIKLNYEGNQVSVILSGNFKVILGSDDLEKRLEFFFASYHKVKDYKSVKYFDMRYSDGFAVNYN